MPTVGSPLRPLDSQVLTLSQQGSVSQRQLSDFILRNPVFVGMHGIEVLARATAKFPLTINRYVPDLDLPGYAGFRTAVGETVQA